MSWTSRWTLEGGPFCGFGIALPTYPKLQTSTSTPPADLLFQLKDYGLASYSPLSIDSSQVGAVEFISKTRHGITEKGRNVEYGVSCQRTGSRQTNLGYRSQKVVEGFLGKGTGLGRVGTGATVPWVNSGIAFPISHPPRVCGWWKCSRPFSGGSYTSIYICQNSSNSPEDLCILRM